MTEVKAKRVKNVYIYLKGIDPEKIDEQYQFDEYFKNTTTILSKECELTSFKVVTEGTKTRIADITSTMKEDAQYFSFLDESKRDHHCVVTMKSFLSKNTYPQETSHHCFWCRHPFSFRPIGCPIQYVPHRILSSYHSDITRDEYTLRENISPSQLEYVKTNNETLANQDTYLEKRDYFLMDGIFCSFNCCLAFIHDNSKNPLYVHSEMFLLNIYSQLFGKDARVLEPAPSWRLLKDYGGHVSIEEFRCNFYRIDYRDVHNVILPFPECKSVGLLFEKRILL